MYNFKNIYNNTNNIINNVIKDIINKIVNNENKDLLININNKLNINENDKNLIFIYCSPKVGSTSIVSSLRIFALDIFKIFHIHDEIMLKILINLKTLIPFTINDIIYYNKNLGKNIYVIDIYRSPIEHKISTYFERISIHFNNNEENINNYNLDKIINRFNMIFPYIANEDYFMDKYNINIPYNYDYKDKYILLE